MDLQALRAQINQLDETILSAFAQRMTICRQVGVYKKENHMPVFQKDREDQVIQRIRDMAPPDMSQSAAALFAAIMDISKCYQQQVLADASWMPSFQQVKTLSCARAGCQGTRGSNSETAGSRGKVLRHLRGCMQSSWLRRDRLWHPTHPEHHHRHGDSHL